MVVLSQTKLVPQNHQDRILALAHNYYGNLLAVASADQRLKVFEKRNNVWELVDSWRAHDGEITDIKWSGPLVGSALGSIGEDCCFKLWQEDLNHGPRSERRYRLISGPLPSKSALPWVSLDFKNASSETYLALVSYDGNFTIMEPKDHDNLAGEWNDWMESHDFWVYDPIPHRSMDTSFRLAFHQDKLPDWSAVSAGLDRKSLAIAVAGMNTLQIFRTDIDRRLYLAAELCLPMHSLRDIAWAGGSVRGYDILASAGKDNSIYVYELKTPTKSVSLPLWRDGKESGNMRGLKGNRNTPSGIGARLAGAARKVGRHGEFDSATGCVYQELELVAKLSPLDHNLRRVTFSSAGEMLISSGDDFSIRVHKHGQSRTWQEHAKFSFRRFR